MSQPFDFDQTIDRSHTASLKYDGRMDMFGQPDVIPLWVADMDFATAPAITAAIVSRAHHPTYGYTTYPESFYQSIMDWLLRRHGWQIARDWIVPCPGVVNSLHVAITALTAPQDAIIIQPPVYFPFFSAVTNVNRHLVQNELKLENGRYTIDFDHLEHVAKSARMLLLCSPHNPVGRVWTKPELEKLLHIAEKNDLVIFSDEIHSDLTLSGHQHHMLGKLAEPSDNIITACAPSKTFNIPGLNLSVLIVPDEVKRIAIHRAFNTLHVNAANPLSVVAFEAAYREGADWLDALLIYLTESRQLIADFITNSLPKIKLIASESTYLLWLDCRSLGMTDDALAHFFVHEARLGLSPGILFGQAGRGFMRMNIAAPRQVIFQALSNIRAALITFL